MVNFRLAFEITGCIASTHVGFYRWHMKDAKNGIDETLLWELEMLQASINGEYSLNDGRLNTFLIFNGILLAVVGVLVSTQSEIIVGSVSKALVLCTALGLISSVISWVSLRAGIKQIEILKRGRAQLYPRLQDAMNTSLIGADVGSSQHMSGILAYRAYPALLGLLWLFALAYAVTLLT